MAVTAWAIEKMAEVMPAQRAMSFSATPKDSIISGMYGKTDVRAIGSAKRHIAAFNSQSMSNPLQFASRLTEDDQLLDWQAAFGHGSLEHSSG